MKPKLPTLSDPPFPPVNPADLEHLRQLDSQIEEEQRSPELLARIRSLNSQLSAGEPTAAFARKSADEAACLLDELRQFARELPEIVSSRVLSNERLEFFASGDLRSGALRLAKFDAGTATLTAWLASAEKRISGQESLVDRKRNAAAQASSKVEQLRAELDKITRSNEKLKEDHQWA